MKKVIDVYASWCGPCRAYAPIFEKVSNNEELKDKFSFQRIDADEDEDFCVKYGVRNIPCTFILDENGNVLDKMVGVVQENDLVQHLKQAI